MNRSNHLIGFLFVILLVPSCINSKGEPISINNYPFIEHPKEDTIEPPQKRAIKFFPIRDAQRNMLMAVMPIPSDWELSKADDNYTFLESPKGVKVLYIVGNEFMYSQNPFIHQSFQQMGYETKPPETFEQVLDFMKNLAGKEGVKFVQQYSIPQLEQVDVNVDRLVYKPVPEQKSVKVVATEWIDDKGMSSLAIIHYYVAQTELSLYWGYRIESMEAPKEVFPTAKRDYINALLNTQINPQWLQTINAENQQKSQQMMQGHQQRMSALRSQGQQIIAAGKQHDAMTTRTHQKFMDGLRDEINVTNPSNGQTYKVNLGSNHYWINESNELITSNDATYDPNLNNDSRGTWVEAQINQ